MVTESGGPVSKNEDEYGVIVALDKKESLVTRAVLMRRRIENARVKLFKEKK